MKIKVLVVGDYIEGSGLTRYLLDTYDCISSDLEITCIAYSGKSDLKDSIIQRGWNFEIVNSVNSNLIYHVKDWFRVVKKYKNDTDIIHFNYSASWNFIAVLLFKIFSNAKIVIHSHNNYYSKIPKNRFLKNILDIVNLIGRIIFNLSSNCNIATSLEAGYWMFGKKEMFKVIRNGIKIKNFEFNIKKRKYFREENNISNDEIVLGFIGSLQERKNPLFALEVLSSLIKYNDNFRLVIFGEGYLKKQMNTYIESNNLKKYVKFLGIRKDINEWYSVFDIFLFPSISEGFGLVLLEAQANGLQCISSDLIPKEAIVTSSVISISVGGTDEWRNSILNIHRNEKREEVSKKNSKIIQEKGYSLKKSSSELLDVFYTL